VVRGGDLTYEQRGRNIGGPGGRFGKKEGRGNAQPGGEGKKKTLLQASEKKNETLIMGKGHGKI